MLTIIVPGEELFDEANQQFITVEPVVLQLEHSLVSLSKWESKFLKPFLGTNAKPPEEILQYIEAMIITPNYPPGIWRRFSKENVDDAHSYIESSYSATTFGKLPERKGKGETITSELIYYWMVAYNIPFEAETWHLNRLFALIRIANIKNSKPKKRSKSEIAQERRELNAQRRAQLGTSG